MNIHLQRSKLHYFLVNSLILNDFEYGYLYPLLKETGSYGGCLDVIFTAHNLSHQVQHIFYLTKKLKILLQNKHFLKKKNSLYFYREIKLISLIIHNHINDYIFIEYFQRNIYFNTNLFQFFFFYKHIFKTYKFLNKRTELNCLIQNNLEKNISNCLILILIYKIWKIEYWYPLISKLAFDCKEPQIAKYFIQITKSEFKMVSMLTVLFK